MMNPKILFICAIAGLLLGSSQQAVAQQPAITIEVLLTFDYPGSGNSTTVQGINDLGDVTGYFEDGTGAVRSFIRYADGTFSAPIIEPNDVGDITIATGINNSGDICGYYFSSDIYYPYRGFILSDTTYTEYGPGGSNYYVTGINDAGDFCVTLDFSYLIEGLLVFADGRMVYFNVGNSAEPNALNAHTGIVGNYHDNQGGVHGFLRSPGYTGVRILSPVDYPGAYQTFLLGLNDGGRVIVGKYVDSAGATHGLILQRPDTFSSFDYPGATETSLNGINNSKLISGYYADASGIRHGFIAVVNGSR